MTRKNLRRWALVFTTMRRKRRSETMKRELGQGVEHFKRAAALAAQEASATVGPKVNAARDRVQPAASKAKDVASGGWGNAVATLAPLITAAGESVRLTGQKTEKVSKKQAKANRKNAKKLEKRASKAVGRKQSGRRGGKLFGLAVAGAAVGAGAAYFARKRRAAQWDEYDPGSPIVSTTTTTAGAEDAAFEPADVSTTTTSTYVEPAATTSTTSTTVTETTVDTSSDDPLVVPDTTDQTSSAQHSPKVARMASGQNTTAKD
jgi:hypothetical protein